MPYYRGDNYGRGDYYGAGDFLGIGGFLKGAVKTIGGVAGTLFKASPIGQVVSTVANAIHPSLPQPKGMALQTSAPAPQTGLFNFGGTGQQTGILNIAGSAPPPAQLLGGLPSLPGAVAKGYHLNKTTYETRGGGTSRWPQGLAVHPKGSVLVRNRRMNVGNARALKRALRRAGGFARLARRVMSFTHPRAGRGHFKFKRRAKR